MKKYVASVTIKTACGLPLKSGDVFSESEVEIGCLQSMLRLRQCVEYVEPKPEPVKVEPPKVEAKPESKPVEEKKPAESKAEPPKIGPAKPPELRGGK